MRGILYMNYTLDYPDPPELAVLSKEWYFNIILSYMGMTNEYLRNFHFTVAYGSMQYGMESVGVINKFTPRQIPLDAMMVLEHLQTDKKGIQYLSKLPIRLQNDIKILNTKEQ